MFRKIFKSREPLGKAASAKEGGATEAEDTLVTEITGLEELVNKRTGDLEEAKDEVQGKHLKAQPLQAESELLVQQAEESPGEEKDLSSLFGKVAGEEEEEPENEGKNELFSGLFSQEEEEANPLAGLITSLPDVTAKELVNEMEEIKTIMRELQQN